MLQRRGHRYAIPTHWVAATDGNWRSAVVQGSEAMRRPRVFVGADQVDWEALSVEGKYLYLYFNRVQYVTTLQIEEEFCVRVWMQISWRISDHREYLCVILGWQRSTRSTVG